MQSSWPQRNVDDILNFNSKLCDAVSMDHFVPLRQPWTCIWEANYSGQILECVRNDLNQRRSTGAFKHGWYMRYPCLISYLFFSLLRHAPSADSKLPKHAWWLHWCAFNQGRAFASLFGKKFSFAASKLINCLLLNFSQVISTKTQWAFASTDWYKNLTSLIKALCCMT